MFKQSRFGGDRMVLISYQKYQLQHVTDKYLRGQNRFIESSKGKKGQIEDENRLKTVSMITTFCPEYLADAF